jgi:hypothetical protein
MIVLCVPTQLPVTLAIIQSKNAHSTSLVIVLASGREPNWLQIEFFKHFTDYTLPSFIFFLKYGTVTHEGALFLPRVVSTSAV